MATLVLAAAGAAAGSAAGAALGAGALGAVAGRAIGGVLGGLIDQRLLGGGARAVETGRLTQHRILGSREGASMVRIFGRVRVAGQVIWASRFKESFGDSGGGKGAPRVRSHRYSVSLAVALCEGPVDRIGRVWMNGLEIDRTSLSMRLHRGGEDQGPDPLIEAIEGTGRAPTYRGVAYLVLEDLDLARFGDRTPQIDVEVFRQPTVAAPLSEEIAPPLRDLVQAVALSPGTGEFALDTEPVRRRIGPGVSVSENVNSIDGRADALVSLDQLAEEAPKCRAASLVVSWFGDDLRCGDCRIRPAVETRNKMTEPLDWQVNGLGRAEAPVVGQDEGRPVFGGTPSDRGVTRVIQEMRRRGVEVMFYPFVLMDVPPGSDLPSPYGGMQPAYPWRGRITLDVAAGRPGSVDQTPEAKTQIAAFFGSARAGDFAVDGERVAYFGPEDWGFRRFILHYAHLCAAAGGISAFCIGSELRGLTTIRSDRTSYPAVAELRRLAADVRAILGPTTKIGYAADWSEYFGHHPTDGAGDAIFHLDPLWADGDIDFVGIDNYMPLSDWRDEPGHLDEGAGSIASLAYLRSGIEGGEGFDWHYASDDDRRAQRRTPISDGAHGEDWVFRYKDLRSWWSRPHHDRVGGVRNFAPTAWTPMSKPIWFTEIGCPAVDKGANQPNVFFDAKSSESALPYFSSGGRDDEMQRRYLQATLGYWADGANNPVSPVYGGAMVEASRAFVWTWDLRPWPDFPQRLAVWADGDNHRLGHWITGRLGGAGIAETVAEICATAGVSDIDVDTLVGRFDGYSLEGVQTVRQALQPLMIGFDFGASERGARIRFMSASHTVETAISAEDLVAASEARGEAASFETTRSPVEDAADAVRFGFLDSDAAYEPSVAEASHPAARSRHVEATELPLSLSRDEAKRISERWLSEVEGAVEATLTLPPSRIDIESGDVVAVRTGGVEAAFKVDRVLESGVRKLELRRRKRRPSGSPSAPIAPRSAPLLPPRQPVEAVLLDAPGLGESGESVIAVACFAEPWPGPVAVWEEDVAQGARLQGLIERPATLGRLAAGCAPATPHVWSGAALVVDLFGGSLTNRTEASVLAGANRAALDHGDGQWEILQFAEATLIGPRRYRLSRLLRGQAGADRLAGEAVAEGARVVLIDDALLRVSTPVDSIGVERFFRIGPASLPLDDPAFETKSLVAGAVALRPYSPAHLKAMRLADGSVHATWIRRTRFGGDAWASVEPPIGEEIERYRVTVRVGGVVRRTEDVDAQAWRYPADSVSADGAAANFELAVSQLSSIVGEGPETRIMVDE